MTTRARTGAASGSRSCTSSPPTADDDRGGLYLPGGGGRPAGEGHRDLVAAEVVRLAPAHQRSGKPSAQFFSA